MPEGDRCTCGVNDEKYHVDADGKCDGHLRANDRHHRAKEHHLRKQAANAVDLDAHRVFNFRRR